MNEPYDSYVISIHLIPTHVNNLICYLDNLQINARDFPIESFRDS